MSFHDYQASRAIISGDPPFGALVMAAMRRADSYNLGRLQAVFPHVWDELDARYNAPGGILPGDPGPEPAGERTELLRAFAARKTAGQRQVAAYRHAESRPATEPEGKGGDDE